MSQEELAQQFYIGFYGRPADPEGVEYWSQRMQEEGVDQVLEKFAKSPEAQEFVFTDPENEEEHTNEELVDNIFQNLFGRDADQSGKEFYVDKLESGEMTPVTIVQNMMDGAQNEDEAVLQNKLEVAEQFTQNVEGKEYGQEQIQDARSVLEGRFTDTSDAAAKAQHLLDDLPDIGTDSNPPDQDDEDSFPEMPSDDSAGTENGNEVEIDELVGTYELTDEYTSSYIDSEYHEGPVEEDSVSTTAYMTIDKEGLGHTKIITEFDYSDQPVDLENSTSVTEIEWQILDIDDSIMTSKLLSRNEEVHPEPEQDYDSPPVDSDKQEMEYEYNDQVLLFKNEEEYESWQGEGTLHTETEWTKISEEPQDIATLGVYHEEAFNQIDLA